MGELEGWWSWVATPTEPRRPIERGWGWPVRRQQTSRLGYLVSLEPYEVTIHLPAALHFAYHTIHTTQSDTLIF